MKVLEYKFRYGSRLPKESAKAVGKRLATLHNELGSLTAESVLDEAADRKSPLHPMFEWDDTTAAREHRLFQARRLIREVVVVYETKPGGPRAQMNAYVRLRSTEDEDASPYLATPNVLSDADLRARLLRQALEDAEEWERRYKDLKELGDVFASLARTRARTTGKRKTA